MPNVVACLLLFLDLASALSAQEQPRGGPTGAALSSSGAGASGCGRAPNLTVGGASEVRVSIGGTERQARVYVPSSYTNGSGHPLLLAFHGYSQDAASFAGQTGLDAVAEQRGLIAVYPQGTSEPVQMQKPSHLFRHGPAPRSWNALGTAGSPGRFGHTCVLGNNTDEFPCLASCGRCRDKCWWSTCADDLRFVEGLLDRLAQELCVDPAGVYGAGFSNGGMLALELAASRRLAPRFAGLASVGGLPMYGFSRGPASTRTRLLGLWGSADTIVPMANTFPKGRPPYGVSQEGYFFAPPADVVRDWARAGHGGRLELAPVEGLSGTEPTCVSARNAKACLWAGWHMWPPFASELVVDFFLQPEAQSGAVPVRGSLLVLVAGLLTSMHGLGAR